MLEVTDLCVRYGSVEALRDVSIKVETGSLVAILGANGAGKSTLLRAISGIARAASGTIALRGERIDGLGPEEIVRRGVSHVPEGRGIFPDLTVSENLMIGAYVRRGQNISADYGRVMKMFPPIERRERQLGYTLSGGEQQMLAIARALLLRPKLLLLDEPSFGLAPLIVQEIFAIMHRIRADEGVSILLVEQNASLALEIAEQAYLLETGRIVISGPAAEIKRDESVRRSYLGY
jgi:branched-chain amino acid transport system ATP-binding protein